MTHLLGKLAPDKELPSLCLRLGSIDFVREELNKIQAEFLAKGTDDAMKSLNSILDSAARKVIDFAAYKLAFVDLAIVFSRLYTGEEPALLADKLPQSIDTFRMLKKLTPGRNLMPFLQQVLRAFISAWVYYVLLLVGESRAEELTFLASALPNDAEYLEDFFAGEEKGANKGLERAAVRHETLPLRKLKEYMETKDEALVLEYGKAVTEDKSSGEMVVRILFGRRSAAVDQFFELHKNTVIMQ